MTSHRVDGLTWRSSVATYLHFAPSPLLLPSVRSNGSIGEPGRLAAGSTVAVGGRWAAGAAAVGSVAAGCGRSGNGQSSGCRGRQPNQERGGGDAATAVDGCSGEARRRPKMGPRRLQTGGEETSRGEGRGARQERRSGDAAVATTQEKGRAAMTVAQGRAKRTGEHGGSNVATAWLGEGRPWSK
uniref:Uncharacterized protein n=1 Tax=Oryza rufipogon TaxID=4529 RepID=A0A0E0N7X6_ORYRU